MTKPEDQLRRLLHDATSDVHPRRGLDQIRARTQQAVPRRRWLPVTLAAAAVTVAVIVGVAVLVPGDGGSPSPVAGPDASPSSDAATPSGRDTPSSPVPSSPGATSSPGSQENTPSGQGRTTTVPVYYVGTAPNGPRLFREFHRLHDVTGSDLEAAVNEALGDTATDPDYRSGFPPRIRASVHRFDGTVTVDLLGPGASDLAGSDPAAAGGKAAVQAIVYTIDAVLQDPVPVSFTVEGQPVDEVLGVPVRQPVQRAAATDVRALVWVTKPAEGATVGQRFTVRGLANAFEAHVGWELKQGDRVIEQGFTTAEECCRWAPYSFEVTAPPGEYTLVVHDSDASGRGKVSEDTKQITVK